MFPIGRGLILAALVSSSTPFWYVGGTDGAIAVSYGGDSIWVYASGPQGPFAFHASKAMLATWADSASVARFPENNSAHFAYEDGAVGTVVLALNRLSADSASPYQCTATVGRWSAGVVLSADSARRFFALLHGKPPMATPAPASTEDTYFDFQVQKQAGPVPGTVQPVYPEPLRAAYIEGEVLVQFAIDTMGVPDMSTFRPLKTTSPWFTSAVYGALPRMRFVPAELHGRKVRELVQQPYAFNLRRR